MHKDINAEKYFKKADLTEKEILWLTKFMKSIFEAKITENDINFNTTRTGEKVSIILPQTTSDYLSENSIPKKFKFNKAIMKVVTNDNKDGTYFMKIEFLYWFLDIIEDFLKYKDLLDDVFIQAFAPVNAKYDNKKKGYKILDKHLKIPCKDWKPIEKTILVGFAYYLRLFQKDSIPSLKQVFDGLKNKNLKSFGLTKASKETFGRMFHREQLQLCWNCGISVKTKGNLCKDCHEYWDEKTK